MTAGTWWGDANVTALPYGAHDNSSRIRDHLLASSPVADWAAIAREVIDAYFRFSPNHARAAGDHRFDGVVGDPTATTIQARIEEIARQLEALERPDGPSPDRAADPQRPDR